FFVDELDAEAPKTRRTLEQVPEGKDDWKPHDKSMPFGRLAMLVARMPSWFSLVVKQDELVLGAAGMDQRVLRTSAELVQAHDQAVAEARAALAGTTDDQLLTTKWRLIAGGHPVLSEIRSVVIRDTFGHLAHHRAQ